MTDWVWLSDALLVQPARTRSHCHAEGRGFESHHPLSFLLFRSACNLRVLLSAR
jgi:hypothetical protein